MLTSRYFVVHYWMIKGLKLKGLDLMVYAIIYGLCQYGESKRFSANNSFLVDLTGATRNGIQKALKNLCSRGLLIRHERTLRNQLFISYEVDFEKVKKIVSVENLISSIK